MTPTLAPPAEPAHESEPQPALRTETLAESVIILAVMTVVQRLVGFGRGVLFCRWLDPQVLGEWEMSLGFLVLASPLVVLGIPGSYVRYGEYYRSRGQLKQFIRSTTFVTALLATVGIAVLWIFPGPFARLIYGDASRVTLVRFVAAALAAVTAFNVLGQLLIALRLYRFDSILNFGQSLLFALLSLGLLLFGHSIWMGGTTAIVFSFATASLLMLCGGVVVLWRGWRAFDESPRTLRQRDLWPRLARFAVWVWLINWLANLFETVDRYMIIHYSGASSADALAQVGAYHSARVIPLVFVAFAAVLAEIMTPHLSVDWEAGRKSDVSVRLRLALKLLAITLTAGGAAAMLISPWLFGVAFKGKFAAGQVVFPLTLTYCTWFGMTFMAEKYLWCAEKAGVASLGFAFGLACNVVLNLILLPRLGLTGAVLATAVANLITLATLYALTAGRGMRYDLGILLVTSLPAMFWLGPLATLAAVITAVALMAASRRFLSREELVRLVEIKNACLARILPQS